MALLDAVCFGDIERVKLLIEKGADVNHEEFGYTALSWAIDRDRVDICKLLLDSGADVNHMHYDGSGWTPIIMAVYEGKINIIKLLVTRGANVKHKVANGLTALDYAFAWGNDIIIRILSWRGAKCPQIKEIELILLLIYRGIIPIDLLREIHTTWIS